MDNSWNNNGYNRGRPSYTQQSLTRHQYYQTGRRHQDSQHPPHYSQYHRQHRQHHPQHPQHPQHHKDDGRFNRDRRDNNLPRNMDRGLHYGEVYGANNRKQFSSLELLRPGPLAPSAYSDIKSCKKEYEVQAERFFYNELRHMEGDIEIMYESVRKFGRFDMKNGDVVQNMDYVGWKHAEKDAIDGLSRLWQIGYGYIFVSQKTNNGGYPGLNIMIFRAEKNEYEKLLASDVEAMITMDPFFAEDRATKDILYV